jgi:hypothetical protein
MPSLTWSPVSPVPGNVVVGSAIVFTSPVSTALPSDANLGVSSSWTGGGWSYVGATDQGVSLNWNPSTVDIRIEEQPTPVQTLVDSATIQVSFDLSEETLTGINLAYGNAGTIAVTAAGAGQPGKSVLTLSTNFAQMALAVVGKNQLGYARVLSVPTVMSAGTVSTSYRRAAAQRLYPTTLNATCAFSSIQWVDLSAPATS